MDLILNGRAIPILVEEEGFEGVKRTAARLAQDIYQVTGCRPEVLRPEETRQAACKQYIICATLGVSKIAEELAERGKIKSELLQGKWEVYQICILDDVLQEGDRALLILGSDKRGTIYGMYTLSEYMGVSPLWFWARRAGFLHAG